MGESPEFEELAERLYREVTPLSRQGTWDEADPAIRAYFRRQANSFIQNTALAVLAIDAGYVGQQ